MSKIRGQDFDKTVIIPPEENELKQHRPMPNRQITNEEAMGGTIKGPPRGLSGWSVFFLLVVVVLVGFGFVLMYLQ